MSMKYSYQFIIAAILLSFAGGCKKMPNDGIPFYLEVDSVKLNTNTFKEGVNSHKITDIWVEANADNLGAYELPINFPVLEENDVRFVISAGIEQSGQSGFRIIYPFYNPDTVTLSAIRGEKYKHTPVFTYKSNTLFSLVSGFENNGTISNDFTGMSVVSDTNVKYGTACGMVSVNMVDSNKIASSIQTWDLPEGQEIWLEFDYKSEVPFYVGFYGQFFSGGTIRDDILFVNSKATWNHLYIKLSESISSVRADTYSIYFEALRPYGSTGGNLYIDNVKLIHF